MAITIPQSDRFAPYTAAAGQTTFAYDFPIYETSDLDVYQIRAGAITLLTLTTDYTVTGAGLQAGGNVVLVVGATLNDNIIISGDLPELRSTNYSQAGDFYKESINTAFNKLVQLDQQLRRDVDRTIHLDPADITDVSAVSFKLPLEDDRKGKYLFFDATTGAVSVSAATGAPVDASFIVKTPNASLTSEFAMSTLATGLVKNATGTGIPSIALDGTDYISTVVADITPQLGGALDVNGNNIVSAGGANITIAPDGAGETNITSPVVFTGQAAPAYAEGKLFYSSSNKALSFYNSEPDITLQIGQESLIRVYNNSGATISNGAIVYASGKENTEDRLTIALAQADSAATSRVLGTSTHDIADNSFGFVTQFGYVHDINTAAFVDGDTIFLSPTTAGGYTTTEPSSPNISVFLGFVVEAAVSGNLFMTSLGNTSGLGAAGDATQLVVPARKGSAGTITKGQVVYVSGYNIGQDVIEIELADNISTATMPAIGIADSSITNSTSGNIVVSGRIANVDTSAFTAGDEVYVNTAGGLTNTKPTGTALIQRIGIINRAHATNGVIDVAATRANDIPNFSAADKYWYGGVTGTATEGDITAFGRSLLDDAAAVNARTTLGLGTGDNVSFLNGDFTGTEAVKIPVGTTAQRPGVPEEGDLRINTTDSSTEVYRGAAWRDLEGTFTAASQAEQETGTTLLAAVTPGRQQYHQSASKGWVNMNGTGVIAINDSYNVASIVDNGTGDYSANWSTSFSTAFYGLSGVAHDSTFSTICLSLKGGVAPTAGTVRFVTVEYVTPLADDCENISIISFGDQ